MSCVSTPHLCRPHTQSVRLCDQLLISDFLIRLGGCGGAAGCEGTIDQVHGDVMGIV